MNRKTLTFVVVAISYLAIAFHGIVSTAPELVFEFNTWQCGNLEPELTGFLLKYEAFKRRVKIQAEQDQQDQDQHDKNLAKNVSEDTMNELLNEAKKFQPLINEEMVKIDNEFFTQHWKNIVSRLQTYSESVGCDSMKRMIEIVSMELLANQENMIDLQEQVDPNPEFSTQMQAFFERHSEILEVKKLQKLEGDFKNMTKNTTDKVKTKLQKALSDCKEMKQKFLETEIIPEMDRLQQMDKEFSTQDSLKIRSFLSFMNKMSETLEHIIKESFPHKATTPSPNFSVKTGNEI